MSNKAPKYCAAFPCNQIATVGAYCSQHKPAAAAKETDPFYLSVRWRRFRAWYLANNPLCEQCSRDGITAPANCVDHIVEIKDGGALLDEGNCQALCFGCHNRKHRKNHQVPSDYNRMGSAGDTY
jgi:5-methylcytosine-specific restriction protein A